jgi:hypothetical protein
MEHGRAGQRQFLPAKDGPLEFFYQSINFWAAGAVRV